MGSFFVNRRDPVCPPDSLEVVSAEAWSGTAGQTAFSGSL